MMMESGQTGFPTLDLSKIEQVQQMLDGNRKLLEEIKSNQELKQPEGLVKNFNLIHELNSNLEKVLQLYQEVSDDFLQFMNNNNNITALPYDDDDTNKTPLDPHVEGEEEGGEEQPPEEQQGSPAT